MRSADEAATQVQLAFEEALKSDTYAPPPENTRFSGTRLICSLLADWDARNIIDMGKVLESNGLLLRWAQPAAQEVATSLDYPSIDEWETGMIDALAGCVVARQGDYDPKLRWLRTANACPPPYGRPGVCCLVVTYVTMACGVGHASWLRAWTICMMVSCRMLRFPHADVPQVLQH